MAVEMEEEEEDEGDATEIEFLEDASINGPRFSLLGRNLDLRVEDEMG